MYFQLQNLRNGAMIYPDLPPRVWQKYILNSICAHRKINHV